MSVKRVGAGTGPLYPRLFLDGHLSFTGRKIKVLEPEKEELPEAEGRKLENLLRPPQSPHSPNPPHSVCCNGALNRVGWV